MKPFQRLRRSESRITAAVAGAVLLLAIAGGPAAAQEKVRIPKVTVAPAYTAEVVGRVPVAGTMVPRTAVLIFPQVTGQNVEAVNFDIGDVVKTGDVLAELNDNTLAAQMAQADAELARAGAAVRQARSQIDSARASLTQAQAAEVRSDQLRKGGNISQASADQATADAETARAALQSATDGLSVTEAQLQQSEAQRDVASLNLARAEIKSPVDGLISARTAKVGAIASSGGEPLFTIIENGEIEVEAEVIETALGRISEGDPATINVAGVGETGGAVRLISPTVDPVNRLGLIRIRIEGHPMLKTGLFASGWVVTTRRSSLTVPTAAVLTDQDGDYVLAVTDGLVARRVVRAGLIWEGRREILSGLEDRETVIAKAGAFFQNGDRIDPVVETAPQTPSETASTTEGADQ